ncbi:RICIN domain-containing protein [Rathayibacter sp. KR2-224]|uniref:RICIN domain-containing protein n=1 Tax=Rathayibacter sp. KR2-224 TaxID=3400913 RepID=UPI003C09C722
MMNSRARGAATGRSRRRRSLLMGLLATALGATLAGAGLTPAVAAGSDAAAAPGSAVTITPNPWDASGPFQGWGTSLAWFANATGGYPDALKNQLYDLLFGKDGLDLTVARYNIGGGNASDVADYLRPGGAVDGYWKADTTGKSGLYAGDTTTLANKSAILSDFDATNGAYYDWSQDATQRWWLSKLAKDRDITGLEAFANSAPWFMTESGYVSGGFNSTAQQLSTDAVDKYTQYLTTVTQHLEKQYGIRFQTLDPFNEPNTNYWGTTLVNGVPKTGGQEGMHVGADQQPPVIASLQNALTQAGSKTKIAAMDETNTSLFVTDWDSYPAAAQAAVSQLNTHAYGTSARLQVRDRATSADKKLWMSEVEGNWDSSGFVPSSMTNALGFANQINGDLNGLRPASWVLWQPVEDYYNMQVNEKLNWGEAYIDFDCKYYDTTTNAVLKSAGAAPQGDKVAFLSARRVAANGGSTSGVPECGIKLNSKFNVLRNYTNFIHPGDQLVPTNDASSTAAIGSDGKTATIVHSNPGSSAQTVTIDLSKFADIARGATVTAYESTAPDASSDGTIAQIKATGIVKQAPVAVDLSGKSATVTVPAGSVTTLVVKGVSGAVADVRDGATYQLAGIQSGLALTDASASSSTTATTITTPATTTDAATTQKWTFHRVQDAAQHATKQYVLTTPSGGVLTATSSGTAISSLTLDAAKADPNALWALQTTDGSTYSLVNKALSAALDVGGQATKNGSAVGVYGSTGGTNQAWSLRSITPTGAVQQVVPTPVGTPPTLPATLTPTYAWGNGTPVPVTWQTVPKSAWSKEGSTAVKGTATDVFGNRVTGTVLVVAGPYAVTDPTSVTVPAGTALSAVESAAPGTVQARIGDVADESFPVDATWSWGALSDASFASPGVVSVAGSVASNVTGSPDLPATLNVIVVGEGGSSDLCGPGTPVTVSAGYTEGSYAASRTCDGTVSTSNYWSDWKNGGISADTLTYELGSSRSASSVDVTPTERAPLAITVQYRDAGGNWVNTSAVGVTAFSNDATTPVPFTPVTTSALRLQLSLNYYTKISEVAINVAAPAPSSVATLAALRVGNTAISGFDPATNTYQVSASGPTPPVVVAVPTDANATVTIDQATKRDPVAMVKVVAVDGTTSQTYTVTFVRK